MKPFLLLGVREHDDAARAEYRSVLRHAGLAAEDVVHLRVEQAALPPLDLNDFSGVLLGGSAFNVSDAEKSAVQRRVESDLGELLDRVISDDVPFLGMCYGIGMVTAHLGGVADRTYAEPVGAVEVTLTDAGLHDPLLEDVGSSFHAFVGHKEACSVVPPGATLLATGQRCPVQMYRVGTHVYVTQFHPELDADDLVARMVIYQHQGYFRPDELDELASMARASQVCGVQHRVLSAFTRRFARA